MRLIDADAYKAAMNELQYDFAKWRDRAKELHQTRNYLRADGALAVFCEAKLTLDKMSTIEPERKKGEWVGIDDEPCETWECDQCGYIQECFDGDQWNFCPNCGADMRDQRRTQD